MSVPAVHAAGKKPAKNKRPTADPLAQVPAAVRKTIQAQVGTGKVDEVTKTNTEGQVSYEVTMSKAGLERSFTVGLDGALTEYQMFLSELPAPAQKTIREQAGGNKIADIYSSKEDGEVVYEVTLTKGGVEFGLSVAADNTWTSLQVSQSELPPPVQRSLANELDDGRLVEIYKTVSDGETTYDVTLNKGGKDRNLTLDEEGHLTGLQLAIDELPEKVQKVIRTLLGTSKMDDVTKTVADGQTNYEVTMTKAGLKRWFKVGEDGALSEYQMFLNELSAPVQKTIREQGGSNAITDIYSNKEDGEVVYEVTLTNEGVELGLSVAADNSWASLQVLQNELPGPVQQGLAKELDDGRLVEIYKTVSDGETTYDVTLNRGGKDRDLTLDVEGHLTGLRLTIDELPEKVQKVIRAKLGTGEIGSIYKYIDGTDITFEAEIIKAGKKETVTLTEDGELEQA